MPAAGSFQDASIARFRTEVREWLPQAVPPFVLTADMTEERKIEIRRGWEIQLYRAGYNALGWPEEFGGKGLGPIEEFVFAEECIAAGAPEPLGRIGRLLAAPSLFAHGTSEQQARFLPAILECREIWCQGFSEPNAGSDLPSLKTTARLAGDRYLINGQKIWTTFGHYADHCLLLARTGEPGLRHRGLTLFALPMKQSNVTVRPIKQIHGGADFNEVFFDDAEVPVDCMIGGEGNGWNVALTVLNAERGAGFAAIRIRNISNELKLLRESAGQNPNLQTKIHALGTRFSIVRWQIMRAIERMAAARNPFPSSSIMKLVWSELEQEIIRQGFESDSPEHRERWRTLELAIRSDTIASGTSEIQRNIISERVLGLPR